VPVFVWPPAAAPIWTVVTLPTPKVVIVNVPVVFPEATVIVLGTVAAAKFVDPSATKTPPDGAALSNVTVPVTVVELPPTTEVGLTLNAVTK